MIAHIFTVQMSHTKILLYNITSHNSQFSADVQEYDVEGGVPALHLLQHFLGTHAVLGQVARGGVVGYHVGLTVMLKAMPTEVEET